MPQKALTSSRKGNECQPLLRGQQVAAGGGAGGGNNRPRLDVRDGCVDDAGGERAAWDYTRPLLSST